MALKEIFFVKSPICYVPLSVYRYIFSFLNLWMTILEPKIVIMQSFTTVYFDIKTHFSSHSAYDATSTESNRGKIDAFLYPNFM